VPSVEAYVIELEKFLKELPKHYKGTDPILVLPKIYFSASNMYRSIEKAIIYDLKNPSDLYIKPKLKLGWKDLKSHLSYVFDDDKYDISNVKFLFDIKPIKPGSKYEEHIVETKKIVLKTKDLKSGVNPGGLDLPNNMDINQ